MKFIFLLVLGVALTGSVALATPNDSMFSGHSWDRYLWLNERMAAAELMEVKEHLAGKGGWLPPDAPTVPQLGEQEPVAYFHAQETKPPAQSGDWLFERFHWRLCFQGVLLCEKLTRSPIASERRQGLAVAFWLMQSPFLNLYAHQMPAQIADCLVLPALGSAPNAPMALGSRWQLLRVMVDVYDRTERHLDADNALRAVIAVADPVRLNLADGARYELAFRLYYRGQVPQAIAVLESITHDALRPGAQEIASQWRRALNR